MTKARRIELHPDAQDDIRELLRTHPLDATRILATIEQLKNDKALFKRLSERSFRSDADRIDISRWERKFKEGSQIWRFKVTDLEQDGKRYRVFYIFSSSKVVHILAVQPRNQVDYDNPDHPLTRRIERAGDNVRAAAANATAVRGQGTTRYVLHIDRT